MSQSVEWIFDWALSHTRRSDAVEIRVDTLAQIHLSTSFESSLVSIKTGFFGSSKYHMILKTYITNFLNLKGELVFSCYINFKLPKLQIFTYFTTFASVFERIFCISYFCSQMYTFNRYRTRKKVSVLYRLMKVRTLKTWFYNFENFHFKKKWLQ